MYVCMYIYKHMYMYMHLRRCILHINAYVYLYIYICIYTGVSIAYIIWVYNSGCQQQIDILPPSDCMVQPAEGSCKSNSCELDSRRTILFWFPLLWLRLATAMWARSIVLYILQWGRAGWIKDVDGHEKKNKGQMGSYGIDPFDQSNLNTWDHLGFRCGHVYASFIPQFQ